MITIKKLNKTIVVLKRFVDAANEAKKELSGQESQTYCPGSCPKQTGAVRRASMDLTRALAELRKPTGWGKE